MKARFEILYRRPLFITGFAAVVLGAAAMTAVAAWAPAAAERPLEVSAPEQAPAARARCAECGVIVSQREIDVPGGEAAPQSPLNSSRRYEITVRLEDGSSRVIADASPADWRAGERVIVIAGAPVR